LTINSKEDVWNHSITRMKKIYEKKHDFSPEITIIKYCKLCDEYITERGEFHGAPIGVVRRIIKEKKFLRKLHSETLICPTCNGRLLNKGFIFQAKMNKYTCKFEKNKQEVLGSIFRTKNKPAQFKCFNNHGEEIESSEVEGLFAELGL